MRTDDLLRHAKIEILPGAHLRGYDRNARTHSSDQVAQIASNIQAFGFTNPILVDEKNVIIAEHGRLAAAERLGMSDVPCIRVTGLTDIQRRALTIADNAIALKSGWDDTLLAQELQAIQLAMDAGDFELELDVDALGFSDAEFSDLMSVLQPEDEPEPPPREIVVSDEPAVCRAGETWLLGVHRLTIGGPDIARNADNMILAWQRAIRLDAALASSGQTFKSRAENHGIEFVRTEAKSQKARTKKGE